MGSFGDFLQLLDPDVSAKILSFLDDPADIVRASSVSHSWHHFVIENGFCKKLCLKLFPEVLSAACAIEVDEVIKPMKVASSKSEMHHKVYAILARGLSPIFRNDCISGAISATSTDNYPVEGIESTLEPRDKVGQSPSYWSSKGQADERVPERLTYRLISDLCFITEINIQPFQAYFQHEFPIYSAKAVRFRIGHLKAPLYEELYEHRIGHLKAPLYEELYEHAMPALLTDDCFEWTYVSPDFPMTQENCLQKFKLPEPVFSIGGTLQIELLGRVETQGSDGLFYICVSHVQVVGRSLLPGFNVKFIGPKGKCVVNYFPQVKNGTCRNPLG